MMSVATQSATAARGLRRNRSIALKLRRIVYFAFAATLCSAVLFLFIGFAASRIALGSHEKWRKILFTPAQIGLRGENVSFRSADGLNLTGWWLSVNDARGTVILVHGLQGNRSTVLDRAPALLRARFNALCLDTRAHGGSEGNYMTTGYKEALDVLGAVQFTKSIAPGKPIIVLGYSRGGAAALFAAAQSEDIAAVVADSPYIATGSVLRASADYVGRGNYPWSLKIETRLLAWPATQLAARSYYYLVTGIDPDPASPSLFNAVSGIRHARVLYIDGDHDFLAVSGELKRLQELTPRSELVLVPSSNGHDMLGDSRIRYEAAVINFLGDITQ